MVYKQRPVEQTPNNIKDLRAIKLEVDSETSLAQGRYNQHEEAIPHSVGTEEVTVYERKDRSQGGRMSSLDPEIPKTILKQCNTVTARVTSKGKSKRPKPHIRENKGNRTIETRL